MQEKIAEPATIEGALDELFSNQAGDVALRRAVSGNHVILGRRSKQETVDRLVHLLSRTNPGRFFIVYVDDTATPLKISVSSRCHSVARGEAVCSEIVSIDCGPGSFEAVPSVMRANAVTGCGLDLFLLDSRISIPMYRRFGDIADRIVIDSSSFHDNIDFLQQLAESDVRLLDWQWFPLWPWRDRLIHAFSVLPGGADAYRITQIELTTRSVKTENWLKSLLLASWITERLGMDVVACGAEGFEGRINERIVPIRILEIPEGGDDEIAGLVFQLKPIGYDEKVTISIRNENRVFHSEIDVLDTISQFIMEPGDVLADEYFIRSGGMRMLSSFSTSVLIKALDMYNLQQGYKSQGR